MSKNLFDRFIWYNQDLFVKAFPLTFRLNPAISFEGEVDRSSLMGIHKVRDNGLSRLLGLLSHP